MASERCIQDLTATVAKINAVDSVKLLRKDLGVESLDSIFAEELEKIRSLAAFTEQHAATVHDDYVEQARSTLNQIVDQMEDQAASASAEYINKREGFLKLCTRDT